MIERRIEGAAERQLQTWRQYRAGQTKNNKQTYTDTHMHADMQRQAETNRDRQRQAEASRGKQIQTETDRCRQGQTVAGRDRQRQTEADRGKQRQADTDKDRQRLMAKAGIDRERQA